MWPTSRMPRVNRCCLVSWEALTEPAAISNPQVHRGFCRSARRNGIACKCLCSVHQVWAIRSSGLAAFQKTMKWLHARSRADRSLSYYPSHGTAQRDATLKCHWLRVHPKVQRRDQVASPHSFVQENRSRSTWPASMS